LQKCWNAFEEQVQQYNINAANIDSDEGCSDSEPASGTSKSVDFSTEDRNFTVYGEEPAPSLDTEEHGSHQPYVEEVLDEDNRPRLWNDGVDASQFVGLYPHLAGVPMNVSQDSTKFENIFKAEADGTPWGEFKSEGEWELAKWLLQNIRHNQIAKFLDLPIIHAISYNYVNAA
jgi:hypothetical protein